MIGRSRRQALSILVCTLLVAAGSVVWEEKSFAGGAEAPLRTESVLHPTSLPSGITIKDVPEAKQKAMNGSSDAAVKLARFYGERDDLKDKIFWLSIAVENGDDEQQLWLARALWLDESDPLSIERSRYWYNRIIKSASRERSILAKRELEANERYRKNSPPNPSAN
jgi:TPR repeat protein